ncbi:MAG: hypothetical protein AT707_05150 [Pyrobaculum sp. JCHS_4]|jgi:hypothetical protein|nr:MAG: hypothetical protein AT707_05150 [Pyrobaculum sp. JCHS_4]
MAKRKNYKPLMALVALAAALFTLAITGRSGAMRSSFLLLARWLRPAAAPASAVEEVGSTPLGLNAVHVSGYG